MNEPSSPRSLKKSHKLLLALLGVIVLAVIGFKAMQPKEPEYQGRRLSEWIADLGNNLHARANAEEILKRNVAEVLPFIETRILENVDPDTLPTLQRFLFRVRERIAGVRHPKISQWQNDFSALEILGTNSIPVLGRLMKNSGVNGCRMSVDALAKIDALEILRDGTGNHQLPFVRYYSIGGLGAISHRKNEARTVLLRLTHDSDQTIILRSVNALEDLLTNSEVMVPKLCELIEGGDEDMQLYLIPLLGKYGTNAASAVPLLEKIKSTASNSLHTISRETIDTIALKNEP